LILHEYRCENFTSRISKRCQCVGSYLTTYDFVQPMECCDPEGKVANY
jgi:hypothetical protein